MNPTEPHTDGGQTTPGGRRAARKWGWITLVAISVALAAGLGRTFGGWIQARLQLGEWLDKYADKLLAACIALAAYLSTTLMRLKERRGDFAREMEKERGTDGRGQYIAFLHRKMREFTASARRLVLPDILLTSLCVLLAVRLAWPYPPQSPAATQLAAHAPAWLDGVIIVFLATAALALILAHASQWYGLSKKEKDAPAVPDKKPERTAADWLNGLAVDVTYPTGPAASSPGTGRFTVSFRSRFDHLIAWYDARGGNARYGRRRGRPWSRIGSRGLTV